MSNLQARICYNLKSRMLKGWYRGKFSVKFYFVHYKAVPLLPVVKPGGNPVPGGVINATLNADPIC